MNDHNAAHDPVLTDAVIEWLNPVPGARCLDLTVGLAGHAALLLKRIGPDGFLTGLDVDPANLEIARARLAAIGPNFRLLRINFADAQSLLEDAQHLPVDCLLADFGASSNQLDDPARGFSFQQDGPLDMRLDDRLTSTAADLVNRLPERELADLFYFNAQEQASRRIAREICRARHDHRITRTAELARVVCRALRENPESHRTKLHPATRTFMALRIAVNNELGAIESLLNLAPNLLRSGGRFATICFHSLEDGLVKRDFKRRQQTGEYRILTKKPLIAGEAERLRNPRSRSAKMRVVERTDHPIKD